MHHLLLLLFLTYFTTLPVLSNGQGCAAHKEKSKQCGATGSVAENCCEGLICNKKKLTCKKEKCAKVLKRSKECGSPSGLSKCCEGLICSKRKRRCVIPPTSSPTTSSSPTANPSVSPTTNPTSSYPKLSRPDQACRSEIKNLGTSFKTAEQCIAAAKSDSRCTGSEIMWSSSYNYAWGCRCCSETQTCPAATSDYYSNNNWDTYEYRTCQTIPENVTPNKGCRYQSKYLGTSFTTPEQCMAAAKSDSGCTGGEIMWSDSYNYAWGCRCCSKHPTCPPGSSRYQSNNNWDVYKYEECS